MTTHEGLRRMPSVLNIASSKLETEAAIDSMEKEIHNLFDVPVPIEDWEVVTGKIRSDATKGAIVVVCVGALWSLPCRVHFSNWSAAITDPRMPKNDVQVHFVDHETRRGSSISSGVPIGLPVTVVYYNGKPIKFTESVKNGSDSSLMVGASNPDGAASAGTGVSTKINDGSSCIVKMFSVDDCISLVTTIKERVSLGSPLTTASAAPGSSGSMLSAAGSTSSLRPTMLKSTKIGASTLGAGSIVVVGNTKSRLPQGIKGKQQQQQQQQQQVRASNTASYSTLPLHSDDEVVVRLNF